MQASSPTLIPLARTAGSCSATFHSGFYTG